MRRLSGITVALALMAMFLLSSACDREKGPVVPVSFNDGWLFIRQDSANAEKILPGIIPNHKWEEISLPHNAFTEEAAVTGSQWTGICWYKKVYRPYRRQRHSHTGLLFDGAMHDAIVYLNGAEIVSHPGGYLPFYVNLTNDLEYGSENEILVRLDNRDNTVVPSGKVPDGPGFLWYGGLYRNVSLYVTDKLHITSSCQSNATLGGGIITGVRDVSPESATLTLSVHISNDDRTPRSFRMKNVLLDAAGMEVASSLSELTELEPGQSTRLMTRMIVMQPALWTPETPFLYTIMTELQSENGAPIDIRETRTGIRTVRYTREKGLLVNGEPVRTDVAVRHQEYPYIGLALSDDASYRDAVKIREAGFSIVRNLYFPPSPAFLDACDELGLMVINNFPDWHYASDSLPEWVAVHDARRLCRRDRNHPSIVLWDIGNSNKPVSSLASLHQAVKEELPLGNNLTTCREDTLCDLCMSYGQNVPVTYGTDASHGTIPLFMNGCSNSLMYDYNSGNQSGLNTGGLMNIFRLQKSSYWFCRSQYDEGPLCFIDSHNLPLPGNSLTIFSNADTVRLLLNDTLLAELGSGNDNHYPHLPHPPFTFKLPDSATGIARAIALRNGAVIASDSLTNPGKPMWLRLSADYSNKPLRADGADVIFVYATLTDSLGNQVHTADSLVEFTVRGNAELIGSNPVRAEEGIASILLRAYNPGRIMIKASSAGMSEAELMTETREPAGAGNEKRETQKRK